MKTIKNKFKIHPTTYFLILTFLFTGYIKNILLIYMIVLFHELGHIFMIKVLHYKLIKVEIYPMGGISSVEKKINTKISHELFIASFGLVFQIILAFFIYLIYRLGWISLITYQLFLKYNQTIFIFNCLPIIPLDGYQIIKSLLEVFFSFKKSYYLTFFISILFMLLFITYHQIYSLNNYLIISFLIYKMVLFIKDFQYIYHRFLLERYLYDLDYRDIVYENKENLGVLKKDTFHYFKNKEGITSEKTLLKNKFQ